MRKLLMIEDDTEFLAKMTHFFRLNYEIRTASSLSEAEKTFDFVPDIAILDLVLPDGSGLDLLSNGFVTCPTIILSSLGSDEQIVEGLDAGAIDYLVKPCSVQVLSRHVELRLAPEERTVVSCGGLVVNGAKRTATFRGLSVSLTSAEFNILYFLARHPGEIFPADRIYEAVWEMPFLDSTTVRRHLSTLRRKLNAVAGKDFIQTEATKGYFFSQETQE